MDRSELSGRKQSCASLTKENLWNSPPHNVNFNQSKKLAVTSNAF